MGPVYEVILALVRNVRNGVIQRHAEVSARCLFLSIADIGCGAFTRARPSPPEPIATELSRIRKPSASARCRAAFLFNLIWSLFNGKPAGSNPWRATTLEWQTPETPPGHGNWGKELPVVYRWAYDYSVPGAAQDFIPQNQPAVVRAA